MKKFISLLVCLVICSACLFSCSGGGNSEDKKYSSRAKKITFSYYAGGFGDDWFKAVTNDYMDNYDEDLYIELKKSSSNNTAAVNIKSGVGTADLYQIETDMFSSSDYLLDISDVYEMMVNGEDKKIKEKIDNDTLNYYKQEGKYYQLPETAMTGWNWVYNKTLLDETFPNGYIIPVTTDEMYDFGKDCFNKGIYLTAAALADTQGGEYLVYAWRNWFAQMLGLEGYKNFFSGNVYNKTSGEWELSLESPLAISENAVSITKAYEIIEKTCSKGSVQYLHMDSTGMNYKDVDCLFFGGKFRSQKVPKVAMIYTGSWLESEVSPYIEDGAAFNQEVLAVKMPVISAIREVLPDKSVENDEELAILIRAIDSGSDEISGNGYDVTQADYNRVKEARNMVVENICRSFVVPKGANNVDSIKKFLTYLVSDRAQKISAQNAMGISMLPYGYYPTDEDMGFTMSNYVKSCLAIKNDSVIIDAGNYDKLFAQKVMQRWYYDANSASGGIASGMFEGKSTKSEDIAKKTFEYYNNRWSSVINEYKAAAGII